MIINANVMDQKQHWTQHNLSGAVDHCSSLSVKVLGQIQQVLLKITSTLQTKVNRLFYQEYSGAATKHETVTLEATMQLCSNSTDALNVFYSS